MPHRRRTALALLATAALVLAACGDDDTAADPADPASDDTTTTTEERTGEVDESVLEHIADAAERTVDEGTARFTIQASAEGTGGADGTSEVEVEGAVDFEEEQRQVTFVGPEGDLDLVVDGSVVYVELPATEDDDWARIDLDELLDEELGMGGPGAIPFQDPADNLRVLRGSAVEASEIDSDDTDSNDTDVAGTTTYRVIIDLQAAAEDADPDIEEATERMAERTGVEELEMQVSVDDDDLIRRIEYRLDLGQASVREDDVDAEGSVEADPEGLTILTIDYSDFGTSLDIEVPDDDQVIDIDEAAIRDAMEGPSGGGTDTGTDTTG
jgi:hypothetical protein